LLTAGFLPPASAGVGGSQKGNLRPSVSVDDDLFKAPYKIADPVAASLIAAGPTDLARVLKNAGVPYASYTSPCSAIFSSS
jgi:hypothetical protein